jgi:hypothetical protein
LIRLAAFVLSFGLLAPVATAETWLTYDRSGGITGWNLKVAVSGQGAVTVAGTRQDDGAQERRALAPAELAGLRALVETALAAPPREPLDDLRHLADGMRRIVTVRDAGEDRLILLSDGYRRAEGDRELVRALESLAQREAVSPRAPASRESTSKSGAPLDLVVVGPVESNRSRATALLLEMPIGRAHEAEGRAGTIELLLAQVLGPHREVLLDGGPELDDPDTGRWSLTVTPVRTRLLVVLEDLPPAAMRDTTARLRRLLQRAEDTLALSSLTEFDHQRRRLADAVHDASRHPRRQRRAAVRRTAWGRQAGASPTAFSVSAIERADLREAARRIKAGHARLLASGPLARNAVALSSRGFERRARGPVEAASPRPSLDGPAAPPNESLLAAGTTEVSQGLAGALALELALRRQRSAWLERLEVGATRLPVPGDTLMLVSAGGSPGREAPDTRLVRVLGQLSRGLTQAAVDARLRRRALKPRPESDAIDRVREAADLLELGVAHPGSAALDLASLVPAIDAVAVRAAAGALADRIAAVPTGGRASERPAPLEAAVQAQLGGLLPQHVELTGRRDGVPYSLLVDLTSDLPLTIRTGDELVRLEAGRLGAASSTAASREQALVLDALMEPATLLAGASAGLFPVRLGPKEALRTDGKRRRCRTLEVLIPARGVFGVLVEEATGLVRAVDRQDPLDRTIRVEMSDIREFGENRQVATRRWLVAPGRERTPLLEEVRLRLEGH